VFIITLRLEMNTYVPSSLYGCKDHEYGPLLPAINHISEWT